MDPPAAGYPYRFSLSIDDGDSPWGGCTTHLALMILEALEDRVLLTDYPLLVRLNPAVPSKTRGNAAVVLRGYSKVDPSVLLEEAYELAGNYVEKRPPGKRPGAAMVSSNRPWRLPALRTLYLDALRSYVTRDRALRAASLAGVRAAGGSGVVGAIASLAALAPWDPYTFELIAYRDGGERCVRAGPLLESAVPGECWANYDYGGGGLVAVPHGPDPVYAGFRGSSPGPCRAYADALCGEIRGWLVFRSNQHTGVHVSRHGRPYPYESLRIHSLPAGGPRVEAGGHVILPLGSVYAAFYRETRRLRDTARMLAPGDEVIVEGAVIPRRQGPTLAAEAVDIVRVAQAYQLLAPRCPRCGRRMKSMGRGKGYKCPRCGYRDPEAGPIRVWVARRLLPGRVTSPPGSARHLTLLPEGRPAKGAPLNSPKRPSCFYTRGRDPPDPVNCR